MLMENPLVQFMNYLSNSSFLSCLLPRVHCSIIISHGPGKSNLFFNSFMKLAVPFQYLLFSSKVITFNWNMSLKDLHCPSNAHFLFTILQPSEMHQQMSLCCIFSFHEDWWEQAVVNRLGDLWQALLRFRCPCQKTTNLQSFLLGSPCSTPFQPHWPPCWFLNTLGVVLPWGLCTRYLPDICKTHCLTSFVYVPLPYVSIRPTLTTLFKITNCAALLPLCYIPYLPYTAPFFSTVHITS